MITPDITMIPADGYCERVWMPRLTTTHLRAPGTTVALCGSGPRRAEQWRVITPGSITVPAAVRACRVCELGWRTAMAVTQAQYPGRRPGELARMPRHGYLAPIAECARCEQVRPVRGRGLCEPCRKAAREDGTLNEYGWLRADRIAEYAQYRTGGLSVRAAARRLGVSERTCSRYEHALTSAGQAEWRTAA